MNKDFRLNLEVKVGGDALETFKQLKEFQNVGFADESATITFNGHLVPAGCLSSPEEFMAIYRAISEKNKDVIRNYAVNKISDLKYMNLFLWPCSKDMNGGEIYGEDGFTAKEMDEIIMKARERIDNNRSHSI